MKLSRTKLIMREANVRDARLCIIATEGAKTEQLYFAMFQNPRVKVKVLPTGERGESAPQHVVARLAHFEQEYQVDSVDDLWLMIDVDRWPQLAQVCKEAKQLGFKLAVSNPCFELWLLLHHCDAEPADKG